MISTQCIRDCIAGRLRMTMAVHARRIYGADGRRGQAERLWVVVVAAIVGRVRGWRQRRYEAESWHCAFKAEKQNPKSKIN